VEFEYMAQKIDEKTFWEKTKETISNFKGEYTLKVNFK
jgi:hypothetical protein